MKEEKKCAEASIAAYQEEKSALQLSISDNEAAITDLESGISADKINHTAELKRMNREYLVKRSSFEQ